MYDKVEGVLREEDRVSKEQGKLMGDERVNCNIFLSYGK